VKVKFRQLLIPPTGGSMRNSVRNAVVALLLSAIAVPLMAQDIHPMSSGPQRAGFWWGFGLGAGQADVKCEGCTDVDPETFPMLHVSLGGTLSQSLTLGVQFGGGQKSGAFGEASSTDVAVGDANVSVYWYPMSAGNLWIQGGLTGVFFEAKNGAAKVSAVGGGLTAGVGYDLRMGRNMSITPSLRGAWGGKGKLKDQDENTLVDSWQTNFVEAGVALLWH
jgi:hypothetical protein